MTDTMRFKTYQSVQNLTIPNIIGNGVTHQMGWILESGNKFPKIPGLTVLVLLKARQQFSLQKILQ